MGAENLAMAGADVNIEVVNNFSSLRWRLSNLYYIVNDSGKEVHFVPNDIQNHFLDNLWYRNVTLKGRQHGLTTLVCLILLDACVFYPNQTAGIIALTLDDVKKIFRRKIRYPYDRLPDGIRALNPPTNDTQNELIFANKSEVSVDTGFRGGTYNYLLISEFGKISSVYPEKATEIKVGSFNTVHPGNYIFVESTGHGKGGEYYELVQAAKRTAAQRRPLTQYDFKYFFYPWWMKKEYALPAEDARHVTITRKDQEYFAKVERATGCRLSFEQKTWYIVQREINGPEMLREFPSCVVADEPVFTRQGIVALSDVAVDGTAIRARQDKGVRQAFLLRTALGYDLRCTADHRINTPRGFLELSELTVGDEVLLGGGDAEACGEIQEVRYEPLPFVTAAIAIDEEFAEFLGFFMGDGSFYKACVSIACDAQDRDVVARVKHLMEKFLGGVAAERRVGTKKGCSELRVSNIGFAAPFTALGVLRQNAGNAWKRKICVPNYIKLSKLSVCAKFLRGLFKADGFAFRGGSGVAFFTKYEDFARDVQLLLLRFGITSRRSRHDKVDGKGCKYTGWEVRLRTNEGIAFSESIGFVSDRKQARALTRRPATVGPARLEIATSDKIASITPIGPHRVMDITTASGEFVAGGIRVHNCDSEPFQALLRGAIFGEQMMLARQEGRISRVPHERGLAVHTWWDIGRRDKTAVWFFQMIGRELRFIWYHEDSFKEFPYWAEYCNKQRQEQHWNYGQHFGPHDLGVVEYMAQGGKTRAAVAAELGYVFKVGQQYDQKDQIEAARTTLPNCYFDEENCAVGITCLEQTRREWNDHLQMYLDTVVHDQYSHGGSSFMNGCMMLNGLQVGRPKAQVVQNKRFAT